MMNSTPGRVFGLSYQAPARRQPPELIVRVEEATEQLEALIAKHQWVKDSEVETYLGQRYEWSDSYTALFPGVFGYGACARVVHTEDGTEYRFPLRPESVHCVTLTLRVMSLGLWLLVSDERRTEGMHNRMQLLTFHSRATCATSVGYGHAVSGELYPAFRAWLARRAERMSADDNILGEAQVAMKQAYAHVAHPNARQFAHECRARIHKSGRFILECPGNACDLAIYPDSDHFHLMPDSVTNFSCHNLDSAAQQLTLLCGLAALCDAASMDLG